IAAMVSIKLFKLMLLLCICRFLRFHEKRSKTLRCSEHNVRAQPTFDLGAFRLNLYVYFYALEAEPHSGSGF
ncbi:MAG: hypothetical protein RSB78_05365, partial [Oscillospiraceae bacterium]